MTMMGTELEKAGGVLSSLLVTVRGNFLKAEELQSRECRFMSG
jgi:hypothetical protein